MESNSHALSPNIDLNEQNDKGSNVNFLDSSFYLTIPRNFVCSHEDLVHTKEELKEPLVDLLGFFRGDYEATRRAVELIRVACLSHGFFQVINHGIDAILIRAAHDHMKAFFRQPLSKKLRVRRKAGTVWGYSGAHNADRLSSKLPWKETLSFGYNGANKGSNKPIVFEYFTSLLGEDYDDMGLVYQHYCEAMEKLSLGIMELLGMSLGVDRSHFRRFFEDGHSIMRCNYYPSCQEPNLAVGTGPHCDPSSLTILHQDQVGGLEVFVHNRWKYVRPRHDALVINIGDTFMALSNGRYKSCLHRAVLNKYSERRSLAYFVCPREDKVVKPPKDLVGAQGLRMYPDFTWSALLHFTQNHYRADASTLESFSKWLLTLQSQVI
ncbi:hypothetical protein Syun_014379 [Stephania yunnanensis]|uniref:Fe2OG dioxygenase domain-containing protein n=1 Tax=Stephania yunnanensis TaxID=152371 RepID=A0AAP0JJM0_9MAGN